MSNKLLTKDYGTFQYLEYHGLTDFLREKLIHEFHIYASDIEDIFSPTQLSKYEIRKKYAYFALQLPDPKITGSIVLRQIHCFVSPSYFFVIDEGDFSAIKDFDLIRSKLVTHKNYTSFDLFYELLDISVTQMFPLLQALKDRVRDLETRLFCENHREDDHISQIQDIKKNIINFKSLLEPLSDMFEDIILKHHDLIDETGKEAIDDSLDKIKKLVNRLDNFRDIMKLLTETNEMIIARSTNQTVRRLTLLNVMLLVPSLTAAFFGMNVHFGWFSQTTQQLGPLITIVLLMLVFTGGIYSFFLWKKWI